MEGLTEGRIVHFVMNDGRNPGQHRPAIVVRVWRDHNGHPPENGCCQLAVFVDGTNDYATMPVDGFLAAVWKTSVLHDDSHKHGTWHWIEKA
jgi:hypothetical protein